MADDLGDRMKGYERAETGRALDCRLPVVIRANGRAFHSFTKGMDRPFDNLFSLAMANTASHLLEQTHAAVAYTQSDEITLVLYDRNPSAVPLFGAKPFKLTSLIAGMASSYFAIEALRSWPEKVQASPPCFDCRAFNVPSLE